MKGDRNSALNSETNCEQSNIQVFIGHLFRRQNGHGHTFTNKLKPLPRKPARRPARVALLLAFAHKIKKAIASGEFYDLADAAKKLGYSRARISQIMKLLVLTPDIQEEILFLERVDGVEPISERRIRMVLRFERWGEQRTVWNFEFKFSPTELE